MRHLLHAAALALLLLAPAALRAQSVRGVVTDSAANRPADGVLVVLLDEAGRQRGRAMTDGSGAFALQAPAPGTYRLRAERVGRRAVLSAPVVLGAGETPSVALRVGGAPLTLAGITASGEARRCRVRPAEGLQTATLWEEARKALNAADWTASRRDFRFEAATYTRDLDAGSLAVRHEQRRAATAVGRHPFVGLPAEELARAGYVREVDGGVMYYAPDAAVLLSDAFLDGHCLRVEEGAADEVGLAFEPVRRGRHADVQGVLWLDRATAELRRLEYRYTGLAVNVPTDRLGGRVEFARLPDGGWFVQRWWIRMPTIRREQENRVAAEGTGMGQRERETLAGLREDGGEVSAVLHADGRPLLAARRQALEGTVTDGARPAAGAVVFLSGTQFSAETDAAGRFRMDGLPEGEYQVGFHHPRLDSLGTVVPLRPVSVTPGAVASVDFALPAPAPVRTAARPPVSRGDTVALAEVRATGTPRSPWLAAARRRSATGGGYYVTRETIARQRPEHTAELFRGIPAFDVIGTRVRLRESGGPILPRQPDMVLRSPSTTAMPGRGGETASGEAAIAEYGSDCVPTVFVDGSRFEAMTGDLAVLSPEVVELIEAYPRVSLAPAQFRQLGTDCGIILIWLREKQ